MSELPQSVRIREVGPRDGFQNEPEVIPTEEKVRLIGMLGAAGFERIELTSFVRPDVIPQLADAERGARRSYERRDGVAYSVLIPNERGLDRALAQRDALRRGQPLPLRVGDPQPQERQPLGRGVARGARAGDRARARRRGCAARA